MGSIIYYLFLIFTTVVLWGISRLLCHLSVIVCNKADAGVIQLLQRPLSL